MCYENNDVNKVIHIGEKEQEYILEYAETDRQYNRLLQIYEK